MIELDNQTSLEVNEDFLNTISSHFTHKDIELIVTTNDEIQVINQAHRGIDKATDVLSFPYEDMPMAPLGTIVIAQEFVEQKAQELGHSTQDEFTLLFIHGLLHLLGFDHEVDNGEMRIEEAKLIEMFHLPQSLIVRTEG
jgi:probable rRNA maturation factor